MIVVDASVLAVALVDGGGDGRLARQRILAASSLHAPHLVDLEILSVLRREAAAGRLKTERARAAIEDLSDLPLTRYPHLQFSRRAWELRANLTPYDAAYVALAETLECPLVTSDARLTRAPRVACSIELLAARKR